jgi:hypothetical protein
MEGPAVALAPKVFDVTTFSSSSTVAYRPLKRLCPSGESTAFAKPHLTEFITSATGISRSGCGGVEAHPNNKKHAIIPATRAQHIAHPHAAKIERKQLILNQSLAPKSQNLNNVI